VRPEPKFFLLDREYEKGMDYYFAKYFPGDAGRPVWGEKSTSYIESEKAARRILEHLPRAKVLLILRNPVYRALSNYFFSRDNGHETRSLGEVFLDRLPPPEVRRPVSVSPFLYLERGEYARYVERYRGFFGAGLRVLIHEKFVGSLEQIQHMYRFLGVDDGFRPQLARFEENSTGADYERYPDVLALLRGYYEEPIRQLESQLGVSLDCWRHAT